MSIEDDWNAVRGERLEGRRERFSLVRPTLIFGTAGVTLALLTALAVENLTSTMMASNDRPQLDRMSTGSVGPARGEQRYTIRRSVLQSAPDAVCIIHENGARRGDC